LGHDQVARLGQIAHVVDDAVVVTPAHQALAQHVERGADAVGNGVALCRVQQRAQHVQLPLPEFCFQSLHGRGAGIQVNVQAFVGLFHGLKNIRAQAGGSSIGLDEFGG